MVSLQEPSWIRLYQNPLTKIDKQKGFSKELMLRPSFPTIVRESDKHDINSEVIVIVDDAWKVGDLVDWFTDGCFWSGEVTKILGKDKVQVDLVPPPLGEGSSYEALSKDLRPSLDWCPEKGWTVPMPMEDGCRRPCARIINTANSGGVVKIHATDGAVEVGQPTVRSYSSKKNEGILECTDGSVARKEQCDTSRNGMEIEESGNKFGGTCFSDSVLKSHIMDAPMENSERVAMNSGYNDEYPAKRMRNIRSICLNSMSSNTIEAAILDLEELVNRIRWLRNMLNLGVPLSGTKRSSWEILHHAPR
ncbi:uncharacterized protein LOC130748018 isoform X2 [Lotus japonicus]|uniref:uncharacterized protein LOC130748018 isoform X2 n=1 Tax=Lotus japonicus TaxID=34305 RepID=UPI00258672A7|nr:uncharacterized protein LOC130748018 isoform X2 [Lotus japonicus]